MTDSTTTVSDDVDEKIGEFDIGKFVSTAIKLAVSMKTEMASNNALDVQDDGNIVINTKLISSARKKIEEELSKIEFKRTTE